MQTADFYSSATGTLRVNGGRDENAPAGVSLSIDDLSYIKQGSRANEGNPGTSDYNDLSNKPSINSVELKGNKSLNDLGIQPKIDSSHKVSADNIDDTNSNNKFATATELEQIETNKNNISLINNYVSVVKNFRLVDLTWSQGGSGQWASSTVSVSGISKIVALTYNKDYYIRGTDRITPCISDDQTQVGFVANVGTFANIDTSINLFILGIASS